LQLKAETDRSASAVEPREGPASSGASVAASGADGVSSLPASKARPRRWFSGLPGRLLFLTLLFVMLAEVLIFVPSSANFRVNWLHDRLAAAHIAALAAGAAPGGEVPARLRDELLESAAVQAIAVRGNGRRQLILPPGDQLVIDASFDLTNLSQLPLAARIGRFLERTGEALYVFVAPTGRMIRAYGEPPGTQPGTTVEVILNENALREALVRHALNILALSIIISMIAAALVYMALSRLLVRPMMRISDSMVRFAENPEDPARIIVPGDRTDEIGVAERQLADMQAQLAQALSEKNRLAQLGLAVSKINHDLRNMLAGAQMMSDRLTMIQDPTVQRFAPKLIASLDRAIDFCNATLKFGRAEEAAPRRTVFDLAMLVDEVADGLDLPRDGIDWEVDIAPGCQLDADREHIYRVLNNLVRNAIDALPGAATAENETARIALAASRVEHATRIIVGDNGPGVPAKARAHLFAPFQGNARPGGTGLGLAIAAELVRAHGGSITLLDVAGVPAFAEAGITGAAFEIVIPDRRV
jgi:signal transduction histidine kinase